MANPLLYGNCPPPFYDISKFPATGGYIGGRFCSALKDGQNSPICCLPCPITQWVYSDTFNHVQTAASWLNVFSFVLLIFCLVSYIALPAQAVRSHYLNTCLAVSIILVNLGFIIPLGANPQQCYNEITPNDMYSSTSCAWSGAFIVSGGLAAVAWIFVRGLSMHLQICWDIAPGRRFFYWSQLFGWAFPAVLFTASITATGVSFRFGNACHINHKNSMADFWAWLLALGAITTIIQFATVGYCLHVYFRAMWAGEDEMETQASDGRAPTLASSTRGQTIRAIYSRLKKVLWLQWRGLSAVTVTLIDVVFFATVFVILDNASVNLIKNPDESKPWLSCLAQNPSNKAACFKLGQENLVGEATICAVLIMLSSIGMTTFPLLFRMVFISAWIDLLKNKFSRKQDFVSLDAVPRRQSPSWADQHDQYEQKGYPFQQNATETVFEMQQPTSNKEYGDDRSTINSPPMSTVYSPTDSYHTSLQNQNHWGRRTPEPFTNESYASAPQATSTTSLYRNQLPQQQSSRPQSPMAAQYPPQHPYASEQPFMHPNPNIARSQSSPRMPMHDQWNPMTTHAAPQQQYPQGNAFAQQSQQQYQQQARQPSGNMGYR